MLAVPPAAVAPVLARAQRDGLARCYTDVASVKQLPLAAARKLGCDLSTFVPGHPMSGRERSGASRARQHEPTCSLAGPGRSAQRLRRRLSVSMPSRTLASACGGGAGPRSPLPLSMMSGFAYRLSCAASGRRRDGGTVPRCTEPHKRWPWPGRLRDVTRVAASSDPALWTEILVANSLAPCR